MICKSCFAVVGLAAITASIALAQNPKDSKTGHKAPPAAPAANAPQPQLPPGMSEADMQACMAAATPGPQHEKLAESVGVWSGKTTMWMTPESKPETSECTTTVTAMMDGRFFKCETTGDMPGMGPFHGFGIYGFDNVSKKFQSTWMDNCGTGMMTGTGEMSSDGKTLTWTYNYNCPMTQKPTTMREVDTVTGKNTKKMEMFGTDPKTGKEYKVMEIAYTRQPATTAMGSEH